LVSSSTASATTSSEETGNTVSVKTYTENDTTIYVADIYLGEGQTIQSALADNTYGKNITDSTSNMASSVNATIAINGDYYGARTTGYVIRNGELLRSEKTSDDQEDLVLWEDGSMSVVKEGDYTAQQLLDKGAVQVLSFGPGLIMDGDISVDSDDEVGKAMASNPRTAIGYIGDNHYVLVVADGRTSESTGLSLLQLAEFMDSLGCTQAYNLDGGGSSTMYYDGEVINNPTTNGNTISERSVSDILYII
jgi:exopolysaccharide biosynthesis protein